MRTRLTNENLSWIVWSLYFYFFFLQQFYLVFTLGQGLVRFHGGGATKGLEQRHKRDIRARTQTDRQTDRQEVLTHRQTQQQNSQGDFNIAVSRLMQPKKNFSDNILNKNINNIWKDYDKKMVVHLWRSIYYFVYFGIQKNDMTNHN